MIRKRTPPGPGQESVWDYPRPPKLETCDSLVEVTVDGEHVAKSSRAMRVLETSHPPVYYFPAMDVRREWLEPVRHGTFCEWKGHAHYYSLMMPGGRAIESFAWCYPTPSQRFADIAGYLAFYPSKADECRVDGEVVTAQPGDFYGGWITSKIVGPFKGSPGTMGW